MDALKITDIKSAITLFQEAAIKQVESTKYGDYKTGNKYYDLISKVANYLKEKDAIVKLKPLLYNPSVGVRLWSAYYLLPFYENESIAVLEQIVKESDIHSLTAETTISEWKKGNLNF